jgi:hypothetical protein
VEEGEYLARTIPTSNPDPDQEQGGFVIIKSSQVIKVAKINLLQSAASVSIGGYFIFSPGLQGPRIFWCVGFLLRARILLGRLVYFIKEAFYIKSFLYKYKSQTASTTYKK